MTTSALTVTEAQAQVAAAQREELEAAKAEDGERYDRAAAGLEQALTVLEQAQTREELRAKAKRATGISPAVHTARRVYQPGKLWAHSLSPRSVDAALELEVHREIEIQRGRSARHGGYFVDFELRGLEAGSGEAGGFNVPDTFRPDLSLYNRLVASTWLTPMGLTIVTGLTGSIWLSKLIEGTQAQWVGENQAPDETTLKWVALAASPRTLGAQTRISPQAIVNYQPAAVSIGENDLRLAMITEINRAALLGSGVGPEPKGMLLQDLNTFSLGPDGARPTLDALEQCRAAALHLNADGPATKWLVNTKTESTLRRSEKTFLLPSVATEATGKSIIENGLLLGDTYRTTNHLPSNLIKGSGTNLSTLLVSNNWGEAYWLEWRGVETLVDPYTLGSSGAVKVYAFMDVDLIVRRPEHFTICQDIVAD